MKKLFAVILTIFLSINLFSQVDERDYSDESGGFGCIMTSFRLLDGQLAVFSGGGGGFIVKDMRIGVFFNGLTNSFSKNDTSNISYKLGCSYGGIWLGYPLWKDNQTHLIADMKFSIGNTRLINTSLLQIDNGMFFGFTPSIGVEYAASEILMFCAGLEYHYSLFTSDPDYYTRSSFSSPGIYLSVKLGMF
ncbi:MAG: hypothetical protein C0596_05195 [Marinilabiliales bacterium]|nr:MAG: hypothetical protein C0596_05195 [Marinilabiliales bacterium]